MKKKFVILTVVVLVSMPAWANLRAPKKGDGFVSGVPDYHHKILFGTSWPKAHIRCDPALKDAATDKKRLRVLEGNFAGIPADILTVLIWFDEKALRYLSP